MDNTPPSPEDLNCQSSQEEITGDMDMSDVKVTDLLLTDGILDHARSADNSFAFGDNARPVWIIEGGLRRRANQTDLIRAGLMQSPPITDQDSRPDTA